MVSKEKFLLHNELSSIRQLPGYFLRKDKQSNYLMCNENFASLIGLQSVLDLLDNDYNDFNVLPSFIECAREFVREDKIVIETKDPLKLLTVHQYGDDDFKIVLSEKSPVFNRKKVVGINWYGIDITNCNLINLFSLLEESKIYESSERQKPISYIIDENPFDVKLSLRQVECLFFVIRGKTAKEIAKTLDLSYRTIEYYIDGLKSKFHCSSRSELIEKAFHMNFFNCIPYSLLRKSKIF